MSGEEHIALIRRLFQEVWNQRRFEVGEDLVSNDYHASETTHERLPGGGFLPLVGPRALEAEVKAYLRDYADLRFDEEQIITEGDTVIALWRPSGKANFSTFTNRAGVETKKELSGKMVSVHTVAGDKITSSGLYWPRQNLFP